jgi:septal ring factor EnvC (AmiA/AmiB activator)
VLALALAALLAAHADARGTEKVAVSVEGYVQVALTSEKQRRHSARRPVRAKATPAPEPLTDLSHAVSAKDIGKLPSTEEQFHALKSEIGREKPVVAGAKAKSDALRAQAEALRRQLIETAARVQALEVQRQSLDSDIARLFEEDRALSATFVADRMSVARLLVVLERVQHDVPPAIVLRPDDALGAARGAMLIGASLPQIYGQAAALARQITQLQETRNALAARRADGLRNAAQLSSARTELNQLLATKEIAARAAAGDYGELKSRLDTIASRARDLQSLLEKVASLRAQPAPRDLVVVTAQNRGGLPRRGAFLTPVVGDPVAGSGQRQAGPGITFATASGAEVVSPADGKVLFSGLYHKYGHVLIVETSLGYDAVLAGLDHVDVRPEDHVLAGEPVGAMPNSDTAGRLYFELRQNGRGIDPAPFLILELRKAKRT